MAKFISARSLNNLRQSPEAIQTLADYQQFLGTKSNKLGIMATLYPQYTTMALTEKLGNIYGIPLSSHQYINNLFIEWQVQSNKQVIVRLMEDVLEDGKGGSIINVYLEHEYYAPNDVFVIGEGIGNQLFVLYPAERIGNAFKYQCKLFGNGTQVLDLSKAKKGAFTRMRASFHGDMSYRGSMKKMSNFEIFDNCLSFLRLQKGKSGFAAIMENAYIEQNQGEKRVLYKIDATEKQCLDSFMQMKNNALLFGQRTYDDNRQFTIFDPVTGFPIPAGDGLVTQIEQYSGRTYSFSKMTTNFLNNIISEQTKFSQVPQGNHYVIMCNTQFSNQFWKAMRDELKATSQLDGSWFYSKAMEEAGKGKYANLSGKKVDGINPMDSVTVGATFQTYKYQGNMISIVIERALDVEYPTHAYGLLIDMSQDQDTGKPAIEMMTIKGAEMIWGKLNGLGGESGMASGMVSSLVHASEYAVAGFCGINVYAPQRCAVIREAVVS